MVVELKSPKCAIGKKEIQQIDDYAYTLAKELSLPKEKVKYKLILISSRLTEYAESKLSSKRDAAHNSPFLWDKKTEKNIEVHIISWRELIEQNKRNLGFLSFKLKVKCTYVKEQFG